MTRRLLLLAVLCLAAAPAGATYKTYYNTVMMPDAPPTCPGGEVLTHQDGKWLCTDKRANPCPEGEVMNAIEVTGQPVCAPVLGKALDCPDDQAVTGFDEEGNAVCRTLHPHLVCRSVAEDGEAHCADGEFVLTGGGACDCDGPAFLKTSTRLSDGWAATCADSRTGEARADCGAAIATCCHF